MNRIILISILSLVFAAFSGLQAEIYQYKDNNGVVVITDKKPGSKAKKVTTFKNPETAADKSGGQESRNQGKSVKPEAAPEKAAQEQKNAAAEVQKKRNEEADRLEEEARKPEQFSKEKQIEQRKKLDRASNLRKGIDPPSESTGR